MGTSVTRALLLFAASIAASAVVAVAADRRHSAVAVLIWALVGGACVVVAEGIRPVRTWVNESGPKTGVGVALTAGIGVVAALLTPATPKTNTTAAIDGPGGIQQCIGKSQCVQNNVLTAPTTTLVSTGAEGDCPAQDPTTSPDLPSIELCVVFWCTGTAVTPDGQIATDQIQYKLRPRIVNNSDNAVSIAIGKPATLRLLVKGPEVPQRWSPPPRTRHADDTPLLVSWKGSKYWAVAPNLPGDVGTTGYMHVKEDGREYTERFQEFATYWDGNVLAGHQVYWHPLVQDSTGKGVRQGDLVFSVPKNDDTKVFGLALLTENGGTLTVIQVTGKADWLHRVGTYSF